MQWRNGKSKAENIPEAKINTKTTAEVWVLWLRKPFKEDGFLSAMGGPDQASDLYFKGALAADGELVHLLGTGRLVPCQFP